MSDSHIKSLLTRKEKDLLLNGYIRQNIPTYIPSVLIHVVRLFYNNLRSLKIDNTNLIDFLNGGKPMITELFNINDNIQYKNIKFRMGIYPNGLRQNKQDGIEFYIKLKSLDTDHYNHSQSNKNINKICIYYELFNQETKCQWKGVANMELNEYIVWAPYLMRLSEIQKLKNIQSLFFCADIKLLAISYKNGEYKQIAKPIMMNKNEEFVWDINDRQVLNKLYCCNYGYCVFSDNFGGSNSDNWCIKYYPEGINKFDFRGAIFIRLLRKPINIKKLKVKYKIIYDQDVILQEIKEFSSDKHSNGCWIKKLSKQIHEKQNKYSLQFKVFIDILEIFDYNDHKINIKDWNKYSISRLKPF